jgi:hypothetical protein
VSTGNIIQRAIELAAAGGCCTLHEIERSLTREGYMQVSDHLAGPQIRSQLNDLLRKARAAEP